MDVEDAILMVLCLIGGGIFYKVIELILIPWLGW